MSLLFHILPSRITSIRIARSYRSFGMYGGIFRFDNRRQAYSTSASLIVDRTSTIQKLEADLSHYGAVLVKAPPLTGKTSLANMYTQFFRERGRKVVNVSMVRLPGRIKDHRDPDGDPMFDLHWKRMTESSWEESLTNTEGQPIDIVIDEVQKIYTRAPSFWDYIKSILDSTSPSLVRVLLFASYSERIITAGGHSSPVEFIRKMGARDIAFTRDQFEQLIEKYNTMGEGDVKMTQACSEVVWNSCLGHVGLTSRTLEYFQNTFRAWDSKSPPEDSDIISYLISPEFIASISTIRAVPKIMDSNPNLRRKLSKIELEILMSVTSSRDGKIPFYQSSEHQAAIRGLIRTGILVASDDESRAEFIAPLFSRIFAYRFLNSPLPSDAVVPETCDDFLEMTLRKLRGNQLRNSLSRNVKRIVMESQWQNEFYRAASNCLPEDISICPDVGPLLGTSLHFHGMKMFQGNTVMDYYIGSGLGWAFELIREGEDMAEHERRFLDGGIYAKMKKDIKEWRIIDFRTEDREIKELRENFWHVIYDPEFTTLTLKRKGRLDVVFVLRE